MTLLVQVALDVLALVDLYRRPVDRLTVANKWLWLALILLGNLLGVLLYLFVGRKPGAPEVAQEWQPPAARTADVADALYGTRDAGSSR